jgi:hypothetical protein
MPKSRAERAARVLSAGDHFENQPTLILRAIGDTGLPAVVVPGAPDGGHHGFALVCRIGGFAAAPRTGALLNLKFLNKFAAI